MYIRIEVFDPAQGKYVGMCSCKEMKNWMAESEALMDHGVNLPRINGEMVHPPFKGQPPILPPGRFFFTAEGWENRGKKILRELRTKDPKKKYRLTWSIKKAWWEDDVQAYIT